MSYGGNSEKLEDNLSPQTFLLKPIMLNAIYVISLISKAAEHAFDLPLEENSVAKFAAAQKKAETIYPKTSSRFISSQSDGSNRKGCFIFQETPLPDHKTNSVHINHVVIDVILLIKINNKTNYN